MRSASPEPASGHEDGCAEPHPDAEAAYAGSANQFPGPMPGRGNFGLSTSQFEQLTVIIDSDFRTSHA